MYQVESFSFFITISFTDCFSQEGKSCNLSGVSFSRSYSNFWSSMKKHCVVSFTRKGRSRNVCHCQTWNTQLVSFNKNLTAICCFTWLTNKDKERFLAKEWHTITPLRRNTKLNWCISQFFKHLLRSKTSMIRSSCCKNIDTVSVLNSLNNISIHSHLTLIICIGLNKLTHHCWLLINFFEHIVWVCSFTNIRKVKLSCITITFFDISIIVLNFNTIRLHDNQLLIVNFHILICFTNHSHGIWADHIIAITKTNQKWWFVFCHINCWGIFWIHEGKGIWSTNNMKSFLESFKGWQTVFFNKFTNQVNSNFSIGLTFEMMTRKVFFLNFKIVFNNTIMN